MKTANPHVQVFNTLMEATIAFVKVHQPVKLLVLQKPNGKGDFFVDTTPNIEEQLQNVWPGKYKVIKRSNG